MEHYNVTGMSCAACQARVEKAVSGVPGVTSCAVSLLAGMALADLQEELDTILDRRTQRYYIAYLLGIPTLFLYTLIWMARISEELKNRAKELGIGGKLTSFRHMFCWNVFGLFLMGPAIATYRFFDTLNKVERELNRCADKTEGSDPACNS